GFRRCACEATAPSGRARASAYHIVIHTQAPAVPSALRDWLRYSWSRAIDAAHRELLGPRWQAVGTRVPTIVNILPASSRRDGGMRLAVAHGVMSEHELIEASPQQKELEAQLIRDLGKWTRQVREFLGYSQDKLAKLADVSQGAVSRVEAGRGKATPLITFWKINGVFVKALGELDTGMFTAEAKTMLEKAQHLAQPVSTVPGLMLIDPILSRLIATYQTLPERERRGFVTVLDATATSLSRHPSSLTADDPAERAARIGH